MHISALQVATLYENCWQFVICLNFNGKRVHLTEKQQKYRLGFEMNISFRIFVTLIKAIENNIVNIELQFIKMNIEEFRTYCLSFKGVHDKMPFDKATSEYDRNLLVFYVMDKWFCFVNIDVFDFYNIKCDTEQIEALRDKYEGIKPGYHMNKKHWISVYFGKDVPDKMIKDLVKQSYEIVVSSLSKKEREALQAV